MLGSRAHRSTGQGSEMAFAIDAEQKAIRDRVDFRIVALPAFDPDLGTSIRDSVLDARLDELTTYFTVFSFIASRNEVIRVPSIEAALASGTKDFCLIQNAGHLFFGHTDLAVDLRAAMEKCSYVMGSVRDRGGYFYLDDQCLLINRRAWEALGRPAFGVPHHGTREVAVPSLSAAGQKRCARSRTFAPGRTLRHRPVRLWLESDQRWPLGRPSGAHMAGFGEPLARRLCRVSQ